MNLSEVSVYDNVNTLDNLSKSCEYRTINDLLSVNTDIEVRIYCPLCVKRFNFKFSLFEHLKTFHNNFVTLAGNQAIRFKECPFCSAKFYGKHLTIKHALLHHDKVIKGLFLHKNKCFFCDVKLNRKVYGDVVKHIEEKHFLDFEEEFGKKFSCDNTSEMSMSDLINSSTTSEKSPGFEEFDVKNNTDSDIQDFEEASRINCYDFTDLKQQLDNMEFQQPLHSSVKKSILKDVNNKSSQKSVRRVLRFDLNSDDEDKENAILVQNLKTFKQISIDEHSLLCDESKIDKFFNLNKTFHEQPQHSSTPNKITTKSEIKPVKCKSTFKSYITETQNEFEYQCGKCQMLFRENLELVLHVKKNHKFNLNALQPCYRCAICSARFYKNHYLQKHHNFHKPY